MDLQFCLWGQYQFIFSLQNFCFLFQLLQVEWKTGIVSFLVNCLTNSIFFIDYDQCTRGLLKRMHHEWTLPHNSVSIFQVENVSPGKTKKLNVSDIIQPIFIKFLKISHGNVGQGQNLQQLSFLKCKYFFKKTSNVNSCWR